MSSGWAIIGNRRDQLLRGALVIGSPVIADGAEVGGWILSRRRAEVDFATSTTLNRRDIIVSLAAGRPSVSGERIGPYPRPKSDAKPPQ